MQHITCKTCVMDTTDSEIKFDHMGVCNYCNNYLLENSVLTLTQKQKTKRFDDLIQKIKLSGHGKEYDCVVGLSGGLDSSYLIFKMKEWGLRALVVHVDTGWNSEEAVSNIEKLMNYTSFDLYTEVIDWYEIRDLQRAFFLSGVSNLDIPQDHIFVSSLFRIAKNFKCKFIISGGNIVSEGVFPSSWHASSLDAIHLLDIHKKLGNVKLNNYKTITLFDYYFKFPVLHRIRVVRPLDYINYSINDAMKELIKKIDWKPYGRKHGESSFTRFFQNYILPKRYGFDKRRPHLSSLILSKNISRSEALKQLEKQLYDDEDLKKDRAYFCKKLGFGEDDFSNIIHQPIISHAKFRDFKKYHTVIKVLIKYLRMLQLFVSRAP